ncbi:alpha/beta hydrolase [Streptomyces sp. Je 1-79]|uniref:alpha/beta hydrolase n=1 Tax=Streptomyces sp. Je 1-79 TaxID=2943847 RepID=UPI0021A57FA1|nr:alpha/beta hydrolase [Streptomyces sp. Je 1-79]MCT4355169.1 alpha/beta hydrolase [Streptomyces sp. Je 1-79]
MTDPLTPAARALCEAMSAGFPGPGSPEALRAAARAGVRDVPPSRETTANGVRVRLYGGGPGGAGPVVVFAHGGGWVLCDLDTHDGLCRRLADRAGVSVVSVDYRRAPEHRFPAAEDDVYAVLEWAAGRSEGPVFLAGDSSGGNLVAGAALRARDAGSPPVAGQLLFYPALDHRMGSVSAEAYAEGFFHTTAHMRWYWEQYLGPDGDPVRASPGLAPDLAGLPPTLVVLADCDPLRDEGLAYARRLSSAGVRAEVRLHTGVFHGFLGARGLLPEADAALTGAAAWLAALHGEKGPDRTAP